jgi:hypothetical protein
LTRPTAPATPAASWNPTTATVSRRLVCQASRHACRSRPGSRRSIRQNDADAASAVAVSQYGISSSMSAAMDPWCAMRRGSMPQQI